MILLLIGFIRTDKFSIKIISRPTQIVKTEKRPKSEKCHVCGPAGPVFLFTFRLFRTVFMLYLGGNGQFG